MRLLRSIRSVNPRMGGPIEGIKQVSAIHAAAGHTVEIVSLDAPDDPWVRGCPVRTHALGPGRGGYGYTPALVPWLREHAPEFDAVIVNGIWQYNSFGVWRALRGTGTPYFVFPHGMLDPWFKRRYPLKHLKKWAYWPWGEYRVLRDARAVLFTCEEERRLARESFWLYRCRERVVSYGTAAPTGDPAARREAFLSAFPQLRDRRLTLFLGRLHEKKGADLAIRAFLETTQPPAHLVMAGPADSPEYLASLKALAGGSERITFTGMLSGDLKHGAFHAADCFLLPSHQENFGIAVVEALAANRPVLISRAVNIWREIEEDGAGWAEEDTLAGTRRMLARWEALSEDERERMRQAAGACFARRFEIHRAADSLLDTLRGTLVNPASDD